MHDRFIGWEHHSQICRITAMALCIVGGLDLCLVTLQLLLIAKNHIQVWDLTNASFIARERSSQQPLLAIFKASGRGEFGVVSPSAVDIWRVDQDLDYRIVLGGHTGPVIAVHTVKGELVGIS